MPGTIFLPVAGPVGTAIAMIIGALLMGVIGISYPILWNSIPASAAFMFIKRVPERMVFMLVLFGADPAKRDGAGRHVPRAFPRCDRAGYTLSDRRV